MERIKSQCVFWDVFWSTCLSDTYCGFPSAIHDKSRLSPSLVKPSGYVTTIFTSGLSDVVITKIITRQGSRRSLGEHHTVISLFPINASQKLAKCQAAPVKLSLFPWKVRQKQMSTWEKLKFSSYASKGWHNLSSIQNAVNRLYLLNHCAIYGTSEHHSRPGLTPLCLRRPSGPKRPAGILGT